MTRPSYESLPDAIRGWAADVLGAPVVAAESQTGGFSPGVAARIECSSGRRAFLKAVSAEVNPDSPRMHRAEARIAAALPESVGSPRLLSSYDDGVWVALLLEEVPGRPPRTPWQPAELAAALKALDRLAEVAAPAVVPPVTEVLGEEFTGWRSLAANRPGDLAPWQVDHLDELAALEAGWVEAGAGDRLLHLDVRSDNMLVRPDGEVVLVDWPWAAAGNPVLDVVGFVPSAVLDGAGDPEAVLLSTAAGQAARPEAVTALVTAFSGLMEHASRQPPPPGIERVRAFQRRQAGVAGRWLLARTGW